MDETKYNKLATFDIIDIVILIIEISELDELKELVVVSKYFNSIVYEQFPKLRKTFMILDECYKTINVVSKKVSKKYGNCPYSNIKTKQIIRKLHEFIFRLLRKNDTVLVNKIIYHIDKYDTYLYITDGIFYFKLFDRIISENYCNEQNLLINLIKISPPKVSWSTILLECFENWVEDLQIDNIIITILDLLKTAIFVYNEDLIVSLIKSYHQYDLYTWDDEKTNDVLFELNLLVKSLEKYAYIEG